MPLKIHLIFKTHLDVGFTNFAHAVVDQYMEVYIPAALRLARDLRERGESDRFIWTTGSWLIYEFLERASASLRREMELGIEMGDITWHGLPFTTHSELMDADLFRFGLSLSRRLDERFGKKTIAAKFTDVPGHTRGIVPLMAEAGIRFLQIGVNGGSPVPLVPPLFRWQDPTGQELVVLYEGGYGSTFVVPGLDDALAFGHSLDNLGPQDPAAVAEIYHHLRTEHPGAQVFASTLNDFAEKLLPIRDTLPVVTQEIGDSWIHGVGSDPVKVSEFRELLRLRREWLAQSPEIARDPAFDLFQRRLLLVPEHTWGMDEKTWLADHAAYSAEDFTAARAHPNFKTFEASWVEKRAYIPNAVEPLGNSPQAAEARSRLSLLQPVRPVMEFSNANKLQFVFPWGQGRFDPATGGFMELTIEVGGKSKTILTNPSGRVRYQTFSAEDYERFFHQYIRPEERNNGWSREDFTKPGLEKAHPVSRYWDVKVIESNQKDNWWSFHLRGETDAVTSYGCPGEFFLEYTINPDKPEIGINLQWFDKKACRLPEALWFSMIPVFRSGISVRIHKLGQEVDPRDVVASGNRHLHASGEGISVHYPEGNLRISSLDAPLVATGEPALLNFTNEQPDLTQGLHFNLYNNVWGTNFPMWLEDDCRFRFNVTFSADEKADGI